VHDARVEADEEVVVRERVPLHVRDALALVQHVEAERAVELARLRESSLALVKELDDEAIEAYDEFEGDDDYVRSDGSVLAKARNSLAAAKVDRAKRRLAALRDEKKGRLSRLSTLGEEISLLWERLDVGEAQQLSFRAAVKHSSISRATFDIGEAELGKLRGELHARLAELVASRRARIRALWDEMTVPDAQRRTFGAYFDAGDPTEASLAAHEAEVAALEARREALQPLLKLIEKREELLTERTALHVLQKDASRLLRRGPGAATERKYEFEAMKRVKQLPKLTEKLFEKLVEWETKQSPVLRDGVRYLDKMRDDQKEAAQERAQALEAKKIEATIRKEKLRDRNLQ
jgi:protein regulator of cytokinesis 1